MTPFFCFTDLSFTHALPSDLKQDMLIYLSNCMKVLRAHYCKFFLV
uniref:Uncharacterized protein n=1 Tax=Rhizophora mucronata TaxID=61149 RepID=A0A2P2QTP8_RHIMU